MKNRVYVSIPLDALIVSGITSDCVVQISAVDGAILIERCDDDCEECCCDCICDECRAESCTYSPFSVVGRKAETLNRR